MDVTERKKVFGAVGADRAVRTARGRSWTGSGTHVVRRGKVWEGKDERWDER